MDIATRIHAIPNQLLAAKKLPSWPDGASVHCFRREPPISQLELRSVEEQWNITLPADYREFISQIMNGGAGPSSGLLPLEDSLAYWLNETTERQLRLNGDSALDALVLCDDGCGYYHRLILNGDHSGQCA